MAGAHTSSEAFLLEKRPPSGSFEGLVLFDRSLGLVTAYHRVSSKSRQNAAVLDLFDLAAFELEKGNQGDAWFVREARVVTRHSGIGGSYESLLHASRLARFISRNPPPPESREAVFDCLAQAFRAFGLGGHAGVVYFKSIYLLIRDEGHPLKQLWLPALPQPDREEIQRLLSKPVAEVDCEPHTVARLIRSLETFVEGHTEFRF